MANDLDKALKNPLSAALIVLIVLALLGAGIWSFVGAVLVYFGMKTNWKFNRV